MTLHLAKAVNGANSAPPAEVLEAFGVTRDNPPSDDDASSEITSSRDEAATEVLVDPKPEAISTQPLREWKASRRAVIHTVDISVTYSQHAEGVVRGFRQAMYLGNVDFHVANVSEWIDEQYRIRNIDNLGDSETEFLSHAILDLPGSHAYIKQVSSALHTDGILLVFNPSLTQILDCVKLIIAQNVPLWLDRVIELGAGMTGGREWDMRTVKPRALLKAEKQRKEAELALNDVTQTLEDLSSSSQTLTLRDKEQAQATSRSGMGWEMICRPKVGERVVGGGFLGVWRKMANRGQTNGSDS